MTACQCCGFSFYNYYGYYSCCRWCRPNADGLKCRPGTGRHPHTKLALEDVT